MGRLAHWILLRLGWTFVGEKPSFPSYVAVAAPHTSNFDIFFFLAVLYEFDMPARALAKHTLFRWPFGGFARRLGLIPIHRDRNEGVVEQAVAALQSPEPMALVIAPEGTRGTARHWKSGFHHIALGAEVPIVAAFVDRPTKRTGLAGVVYPTTDLRADMDQFRNLYEGIQGFKPARRSPVTLADEEPAT